VDELWLSVAVEESLLDETVGELRRLGARQVQVVRDEA
jgi:hypothetical protein